ncbi:MAG: sulfotransferase, partial [Alphaproteobacteria bacterium]
MSGAPARLSITAPLFLVSEVQRSGGSMMAQLFDGHPQIYAHPFEIQIGHPKKWFWPDLDLADAPETWFERLFEEPLRRFVAEGFAKRGSNPHAAADRRPFHFDIDRQRGDFLARTTEARPASQRAILDAYFSSFFTAWRDWSPTGRERCVAGFTPALIAVPDSVERFFADYPDGRMLTIVRDPRSWWVSARNHYHTYRDLDRALEIWTLSARASLGHAKRRPDRVLPLTYERLVREPEPTMRRVASFLGSDFDPTLTEPTFLGQ